MADRKMDDNQCDCDIGMCTHRANCRNAPFRTTPVLSDGETLIERCAKIADPWPGFQLSANSTDADRAVVGVRSEIAKTIRALYAGSGEAVGADREQIAAMLYITRFPHRTWISASLPETALAYKQADSILALRAASVSQCDAGRVNLSGTDFMSQDEVRPIDFATTSPPPSGAREALEEIAKLAPSPQPSGMACQCNQCQMGNLARTALSQLPRNG